MRSRAARAKEKGVAAIAGEAAAERYGLKALARSDRDDPNNTKRFLVLGRLEPAPDRQGPHLARHVGETSPARCSGCSRRSREQG